MKSNQILKFDFKLFIEALGSENAGSRSTPISGDSDASSITSSDVDDILENSNSISAGEGDIMSFEELISYRSSSKVEFDSTIFSWFLAQGISMTKTSSKCGRVEDGIKVQTKRE